MTVLSEAAGETSTPLLRETIGANLARTVGAHGERAALVSCEQGITWTYNEYAEQIELVARGLLGLGFNKGDRIGIWSPNNAEWALVQFATARIGVILVNINPAYRTHEVRYALAQSGCRGLVTVEQFKTSDYRAMVEEVLPALPDLEHVIFIGTSDWEEVLDTTSSASVSDLEALEATLHYDDAINIQYTSGTTGNPKGATLTHLNILNNGYFVGRACGYSEDDRIAVPVPLYHCFGMVMGNLAASSHGACVVYPSEAADPKKVLAAVSEQKCTSLYGVPTMFIAELGDETFEASDLSSLRTGIMAGSPCPAEAMTQVVDRMNMDQVTIAYGMTETSPVSCQTATDDPLDKRVGTVGRVHPHVEIKIIAGDIREFCQDRIAHFKIPRYVATIDEFPMTVTGKIQKYKLREIAMVEFDLDE